MGGGDARRLASHREVPGFMHKRVLIAGAGAILLALWGAAAVPVAGQDTSSSASSSSSASASSSAPAASGGDDATRLATGKHIWNDAACYNCHGANGAGGHSADFPPGPNLRTSGLDPKTMLQIVECGVPGTKMPAWLKGAYTETACYGKPLGTPSDVQVSGAFSEDELKALVDYVQTNFMKQAMPTWSAQQ
jgi:mono/diheme cytochrome c family protein